MPSYKLRCEGCSKDFELFLLRLLREEDKVCPFCKSREVSLKFQPTFLLAWKILDAVSVEAN